MQLSDLDPNYYTHRTWLRFQDKDYLIGFRELTAINIFIPEGGDSIRPFGQVNANDVALDRFSKEVVTTAITLIQPSMPDSLTQLAALVTQAKALAQSLRDSESTATRDGSPGAVGRELSYAIVKLREASFWVREASEIKAAPTNR